MGILSNLGIIQKENIDSSIFIGEISYNGNINSVKGVLPRCLAAQKMDLKGYIYQILILMKLG